MKRSVGPEAAMELLKTAPYIELASTNTDALPVLRTLNGVLIDDWMFFHGAFAGEKSTCLERPAVISAYEVVCDIPSYFVDEQKACPATTYYRSVQAKGILKDIQSVELKMKTLQALMDKMQPEGHFVPFAQDLELYKKNIKSTRVFGLKLEEISGKASIGQDKPPEFTQKIVRGLFERGKAGDLAAIEIILAESPQARPNDWCIKTETAHLTLHVHPYKDWIEQHAELLDNQYWRTESSHTQIKASIEASQIWIGAVNEEGQLVAAARANADRTWVANIFDVVVHPAHRRKGVGTALMRLLLDHPLVRNCKYQRLGTKESVPFYSDLGFKLASELPHHSAPYQMVRLLSP